MITIFVWIFRYNAWSLDQLAAMTYDIVRSMQFNDDEVVFDMANGCVCCTVRGDLIEIFKKLQKRQDRFDRIIVETTGMADPAPVCQTFFVDDAVRAFAKIDAGTLITSSMDASESRSYPGSESGMLGVTASESNSI
jgi:G3E family GTPase